MILEGMACLVGGNPHRGQRPTSVDVFREPQHLCPRVVMIGELSRNLLDGDLRRPGRIEDVAGRGGPGENGQWTRSLRLAWRA